MHAQAIIYRWEEREMTDWVMKIVNCWLWNRLTVLYFIKCPVSLHEDGSFATQPQQRSIFILAISYHQHHYPHYNLSIKLNHASFIHLHRRRVFRPRRIITINSHILVLRLRTHTSTPTTNHGAVPRPLGGQLQSRARDPKS